MNHLIRVLIIDDNPQDIYFISRALRQPSMNVDVHAANSLEQLNQKLKPTDQAWHIIILDYVMPTLDVVEALAQLQQCDAEIPVLIVSGQVQTEAVVELMRLGVRDFIRKDDLSRLAPCVRRELKAAELRRERQQALVDLKVARDEAERASQAKSDFLLMLNHELRTPLHGIMGMLDLLLADMHGMSAKQREYASISRTTADGMYELISDMLDLSKLEADKSNLQYEAFDLKACLQSSMTPFFIAAREKGLAFVLDLQQVPQYIVSDRVHVHQMLINLLGNAVKFTDQGQITLRAQILVSATGEEELQIDVEDSGIGIAAEYLDSIFEPFEQCFDRQGERPRGTGLGTTLVKRFSALLGGRVELSSEAGVGSCFSLILPLQREGDAIQTESIALHDWPVYGEETSRHIVQSMDHLRVLVAEDDAVSQHLMAVAFEQLGLSVDCADHGLEAWNKLQQYDYDVLLTDLRMPGLNGIELTQRVRASEKRSAEKAMLEKEQSNTEQIEQQSNLATPLSIIGISAYAQAEMRDQALQAGMDAFVSKPVNVGQVIELVRQQHTQQQRSEA